MTLSSPYHSFNGFFYFVYTNYQQAMKKYKYILLGGLYGLLLLGCSINQTATTMTKKNNDPYAQMPFFPAEVKQADNFYAVQITATTGAFFTKNFVKHGLYGNGYCWESIIAQLVAKKQKELLSKITFDAEADTCFISCEDETSMNALAQFSHQELSSKEKFDTAIQNIDRSTLDC